MSNLGLNFYPPTIYFNEINFNNDFYAIPNNNQGISLAYANTHFLFSTGVANSTATSTFFSGSVGVGAIATGLSGDMNALTYLLNGNNISNIFVSSNVLSNTSNILNSNINTKEDRLTFNTPFSRVNNTLSLLYDASLNIDGTGKLSVASGNSSKWTTSGNNIFNNNIGNVGIGSQIPAYKLDVSGDINANRFLLNGNNISNIFVASNVLSNTSNTIHNNYSNLNALALAEGSNTSNTIHFNYSNLNLNTSNTIYFNYSNLNSNTSNNNYIYTSNNIDRFNITLPDTNFWYDYTNSLWCYDLNIEKYIPSSNLGSGFKARSFRIQTLVPKADWRTFNNLYMNNQFINNPETLVFHMNNYSNYFGNITPNDNYANAIVLGKSRDTNIGYWNIIPNNYNYIRYRLSEINQNPLQLKLK